jgi:amidohydrolase
MTAAALDRAVHDEVERLGGEMVRVRRYLHARPELAFEEAETAALAAERCAELGFAVRTGVGGTGVLADLDSGRPGPMLLVRADMDALPIAEGDDGRPYRSTVPGVMHACGHDGHVAVAIAVAEILARLRSSWSGRVRICFQPAEEVDAGAQRMIDDGALQSVDCALGLHLQAGLQTGTVAVGPGVQWASSDELRLTIEGVGGHAGDPTGTINPIPVAAAIVLELERLPAPAVATIAQIQAGTASNVTPEAVSLAGTLRSFGDRAQLLEQVERIAERTARSRGAAARFSIGASCPAVVCDPDVTDRVRGALTAMPADVVDGEPSTASDDMARFLQAVPGTYFRVGASDLTDGPAVPHHHPLFDLDERALPLAAEALVRAALALLGRG